MLLYLLRHADAETAAENDDARALSEKGWSQARRVAHFCEQHAIKISTVLTSPLRRAHETAGVVAGHLQSDLVVAPWLAPGMEGAIVLEELRAYRAQTAVMLVGHEPDFSTLGAFLLGLGSPTQIHIRKAALALFEIDVLRAGAARLEFSLPCRFM